MPRHAFLRADARRLPLASRSVHAVVTSPPYYDLRRYTGDPREIGAGGIDRYVDQLSAAFAECRRVLRDDGVLFLNLGDTYARKQLMGVPWAVAFRLKADGWFLRSDSVWFKPNGFPDSAADRPEAQHEYCFVFSKGDRNYWDKYAVDRPDRLSVRRVPVGRSRHAHFASYPPGLVLPFVRQATSEVGCCPACGAPWHRKVLKTRTPTRPGRANKHDATGMAKRDDRRHVTTVETLGWHPTCRCGPVAEGRLVTELELASLRVPVAAPCTVLDPFAGACTTALACAWAGRNSVSADLGGDYLALGRRRVGTEVPPRRRGKAARRPLAGQLAFPYFSAPV